MKKKVKMIWNEVEKCWQVIFDNGKMIFETTNYRKAFFWVKYQKNYDAKFVLDYINNV